MKITAVGGPAVGKSCLLTVLRGRPFPQRYCPRVIESYVIESNFNGAMYNWSVWDTPGNSEYIGLRSIFYDESDLFLLCFALNSRDSLEQAETIFLPEILNYCRSTSMMLVGLKSDIYDATNPEHVSESAIQSFLGSYPFEAFIKCSAMTGAGLEDLIGACVEVRIHEGGANCCCVL